MLHFTVKIGSERDTAVPVRKERKKLGMIEIIREEKETGTKESGLPKEIRQIGNADVGDRIYLEENAYRYLHDEVGWDAPAFGEGRKVFVLLGKIDHYAGQKCVFVENAIEIEDITYLDGVPVWNDKTWSFVFGKMKKLSEDMIVVGWSMDIKDCAPSLTDRLAGVHMTHFGGKHQLLFLLDSMEKEENFYCNRQGRLRRREGFYLYHDKRALASVREEVPHAEVTIEQTAERDDLERLFWEQEPLKQTGHQRRAEAVKAVPEEKTEGRFRFSPSYLLAAIALVLVVAAYQNNSQMKSMSETIAQMNVAGTMFGDTEETETSEVEVEQLSGNIEKSTEQTAQGTGDTEGTESTQQVAQEGGDVDAQVAQSDSNVQNAQGTESTQTADTTQSAQDAQSTDSTQTSAGAAQSYLADGYYIVQKGDNLAGICMKVYQTTAMMDKVCEVNGIENSDAIYEGQCLTLPK